MLWGIQVDMIQTLFFYNFFFLFRLYICFHIPGWVRPLGWGGFSDFS